MFNKDFFTFSIVKTVLKLCLAAFVGFVVIGVSQNIIGALIGVLIYGQALIIEAIRDLKR